MVELVDSELNGASAYYSFRKTPTQVTVSGQWFDLSMSPGNPVPQYYIGTILTSTPFSYTADGGIPHGGAVAPKEKFIRQTTLLANSATGSPMTIYGLDYLIFYPFIDESTTDPQTLVNSVALPRYTDGKGVLAMAISVAGRTGGQSFFYTYTNQDGVSGRVSPNIVENNATANGIIVSSATVTNGAFGPFLPMQSGDTGIRSIESVTMNGADVGLFTIVLVKPLFQTQIRGVDAPVERDYFLQGAAMPQIQDNAYVNLICLPTGSLSGVSIFGDLKTVWN
jgi:hypothetical protein